MKYKASTVVTWEFEAEDALDAQEILNIQLNAIERSADEDRYKGYRDAEIEEIPA